MTQPTPITRSIVTTEADAKGWVTVTVIDQHPSGQKLNLSFAWPAKDTGLEAYLVSWKSLQLSMDHLLGQSMDDIRRDSPWAIPPEPKVRQMTADDLGLAPKAPAAV